MKERAESLIWLLAKSVLVRAGYVPGHEPERGGRLTDCSAGHPERRGPAESRLLLQLSAAHYESTTAKDCPTEAFKPQSLSRVSCVLVTGNTEL